MLEQRYKSYSKCLNKLIDTSKKIFETAEINKCDTNRKLWSYVNNRIKNTNSNKNSINKILVDGNSVVDKYQMANHFNKFFNSVGEKLANNVKKPENCINFKLTHNKSSIFLSPITETEIETVIGKLKNKTPGVDGISAKSLKVFSTFIRGPLSNIFNNCIAT